MFCFALMLSPILRLITSAPPGTAEETPIASTSKVGELKTPSHEGAAVPETTKTPTPEPAPEAAKTQHETTTEAKTEAAKPQPETTETKTEAAKAQPETTEAKTEAAKPQPETTEAKPEAAKPQPEAVEAKTEAVKSQTQTAEPKSESTETKPETATVPKPETTTETKPETTTEPKPETTTEPKPETTTEPKPETTTGPKPEATTEPKPETTTEPKPEATTETKPEATTETKSEDDTKKPVISEGPKLFIGKSETKEEKQVKSLNKDSVLENQQRIEFVVDMVTPEGQTKYSPKLLAFKENIYSNLQLLKYKTCQKTDDGKALKETANDEKFNFTNVNLVIEKMKPEEKSLKYVVSICSEKGKEDNLFEKLIDEKNKDAAWELKLTLEDDKKPVGLKTFPFKIDKTTTPYSLVNVITGKKDSTTPWYKDWKVLIPVGASLLILGIIAYVIAIRGEKRGDNYE